jgi:hypothetical protein
MFVLPVLVALASAGDPQPTVQPSGSPTPTINPALIDPCISAAADLTTTIGVDDDGDVLKYNSTAYGASTRKCKRFVAEFKVLSNADAADSHSDGTLRIAAGPTTTGMPTTQASCNNLKVYVTSYKKAAGQSSFTKIASATYAGGWVAEGLGKGCWINKISGTEATGLKPNAAGTDVYHVTVSADVSGVLRPVEASMSFNIVPW